MRIGTIAGWAGFAYVAAWLTLGNLLEARWNPKPPRERYMKDPNGWPLISFWNMFDQKKWTEEGIRYHEKRMLATIVAVPAFILGWLILGWIF